MTNPPSDQGIPVLTEVIGQQPRPEADIPAAPQAAPAAGLAPGAAAAASAIAPAPAGAQASPARNADAAAPTAPARTPPPSVPDIGTPPPLTQAKSQAPAGMNAEHAPAIPAEQPAPAAQAASGWSDSELRDLESELRLRITRQVLGRIDFVLDHRVRNTLTEIVDTAIDALAAEIKRGLHDTLTDMVARAVAQEIARLQSAKK